MKKLIVILLAGTILLTASACSNAETPSLSEKGLELTMQMDRLAENETYRNLFSNVSETLETMKAIGGQDYSKPRKTFEITGLDSAMMQLLARGKPLELSAEIETVLKTRFGSSAASQLNTKNGSSTFAALSALSAGDSFLAGEVKEQKSYLYLYEGTYSSMVTFVPYQDGVVNASASFVMREELSALQTADDVRAFFADTMQLEGLTITLVNL